VQGRHHESVVAFHGHPQRRVEHVHRVHQPAGPALVALCARPPVRRKGEEFTGERPALEPRTDDERRLPGTLASSLRCPSIY
jgi:hypothetical protein